MGRQLARTLWRRSHQRQLGNELKFENQKLTANYLRMGYDPDGSWRIYKLRPDFNPADKVQVEDDITASVVLPKESLSHLDPEYRNPSVKLVQNCEMHAVPTARRRHSSRLRQRCRSRYGRARKLHLELRAAGPHAVQEIMNGVVEFDKYTEPMKRLLKDFVADPHPAYVVSSAHPRIVDGAPSNNPRYLQRRPDLVNPRDVYHWRNRHASCARNSG